jgi:hypothetical protein
MEKAKYHYIALPVITGVAVVRIFNPYGENEYCTIEPWHGIIQRDRIRRKGFEHIYSSDSEKLYKMYGSRDPDIRNMAKKFILKKMTYGKE